MTKKKAKSKEHRSLTHSKAACFDILLKKAVESLSNSHASIAPDGQSRNEKMAKAVCQKLGFQLSKELYNIKSASF